jgi:hypothetical protein
MELGTTLALTGRPKHAAKKRQHRGCHCIKSGAIIFSLRHSWSAVGTTV